MNRLRVIVVVLVSCLLAGVVWQCWPLPPEPVWKGRTLTEWLHARNRNRYYAAGQPLHSGLPDEEIDAAIEGIGQAALPYLRVWLTARESPSKEWFNRQLRRLGIMRFRFQDNSEKYHDAMEGFYALNADASPLLPYLLKLSRDRDPELRGRAYEAAFWVGPDKEEFLAMVREGVKESDPTIRGMSAQWWHMRYPEEAEQAGVRGRFPEAFADALHR